MAAERTARGYLGAAPMTRLFHLSNLNQAVIVRKRERVISVQLLLSIDMMRMIVLRN